jgi:hypothetical protein
VGVGWGLGAALAAFVLLCVAPAVADTDGPDAHAFIAFGGTDLWRDGAFLYGGLLWSPNGFGDDGGMPGFTLKLLLASGGYTYPSSGLHTDVDGTLVSASALPGLRMTRDGVTVSLYAGPIAQNYWLMPNDPGSRLRGFYVGGQLAADIWSQPTPTSMIALNGSIASIAAIGTMRVATGWQFSEPFFVGPEVQALWCIDYQQWRVGVHVTSFRFGGAEWTAASGLAVESFGRTGPYLRLGLNVHY